MFHTPVLLGLLTVVWCLPCGWYLPDLGVVAVDLVLVYPSCCGAWVALQSVSGHVLLTLAPTALGI